MTPPAAGRTRRYETTVRDVREVALVGPADAGPWTDLMAPEGLRPLPVDGAAELGIMACATTYMGVRFRELVVTVTVAQPTSTSELHGAYLAKAWNSVRVFAFVERAWFKTPYEPAQVRVEVGPPAALGLVRDGRTLLGARMAGRPADAEPAEDAWEGTVFVPRRPKARAGQGKLFFARLRGACREHAFGPDDAFAIEAGADPVLELVRASGFRPRAWRVRTGAEHSRSRSYARVEAAQPG